MQLAIAHASAGFVHTHVRKIVGSLLCSVLCSSLELYTYISSPDNYSCCRPPVAHTAQSSYAYAANVQLDMWVQISHPSTIIPDPALNSYFTALPIFCFPRTAFILRLHL